MRSLIISFVLGLCLLGPIDHAIADSTSVIYVSESGSGFGDGSGPNNALAYTVLEPFMDQVGHYDITLSFERGSYRANTINISDNFKLQGNGSTFAFDKLTVEANGRCFIDNSTMLVRHIGLAPADQMEAGTLLLTRCTVVGTDTPISTAVLFEGVGKLTLSNCAVVSMNNIAIFLDGRSSVTAVDSLIAVPEAAITTVGYTSDPPDTITLKGVSWPAGNSRTGHG